jgi:uncharacterized protein with HEPN domain
MREPARDKGRLQDILGAIDNIYEFVEGKSRDQVLSDKICYYAVVYQLVVIGEAANLLTKEFIQGHPETPWRAIVSMRNFIVHGYNIVDKQEVWSVIKNDLHPLKTQITQYSKEMQ